MGQNPPEGDDVARARQEAVEQLSAAVFRYGLLKNAREGRNADLSATVADVDAAYSRGVDLGLAHDELWQAAMTADSSVAPEIATRLGWMA